jgi:hypothetical protein
MPQRLLCLLFAWLLSVTAYAEVSFSGRINTGLVYFSAKSNAIIPLISNEPIKNNYSDTIPNIGLGGTLSYKKFYADLFYATTLGEGKDPNRSPVSDPLLPASIDTRFNNKFDLNEWRLTVGYSLSNQFSLFAGYLYAGRSLTTNPDFFLTATPGFSVNPTEVQVRTSYKYNNQGPFVGFGYGIPLGKGALISSFALGYFEREGKTRIQATANSTVITAPDGSQIPVPPTDISVSDKAGDGETTALSFSLRYLYPLSEKLALEGGFSGYRYAFDSNENLIGGVQRATSNREDYLFLNLGLRYRF